MPYCNDYLCINKDPWSGACKSTVCTKQNKSETIYLPEMASPKNHIVIWEQQPKKITKFKRVKKSTSLQKHSRLVNGLYCPICGSKIRG